MKRRTQMFNNSLLSSAVSIFQLQLYDTCIKQYNMLSCFLIFRQTIVSFNNRLYNESLLFISYEKNLIFICTIMNILFIDSDCVAWSFFGSVRIFSLDIQIWREDKIFDFRVSLGGPQVGLLCCTHGRKARNDPARRNKDDNKTAETQRGFIYVVRSGFYIIEI